MIVPFRRCVCSIHDPPHDTWSSWGIPLIFKARILRLRVARRAMSGETGQMAAFADAFGLALVGRDAELGAVGTFLNGVASGTAGTLLITGDPGVGKTALVQQACATVNSDAVVLTGTCLPLTSMTVPFLALRSAVRAMPRTGGIPRPGCSTPRMPPRTSPWNSTTGSRNCAKTVPSFLSSTTCIGPTGARWTCSCISSPVRRAGISH